MTEECIICGDALEYLDESSMMECVLCKKKVLSKACCVNGHYVCDDCHLDGLNSIFDVCLNIKSGNPFSILNKLMHLEFCHMHGPEHHVLVGASLLTAYNNCGGNINLEECLIELMDRAKKVPGGTCGYWGACGAGISTGIFMSIILKSTPLSARGFKLSNKMTSLCLNSISDHGGPRCCKRDSYLSLLCAVDFVRDNFGINMEKDDVVCDFSDLNNQCLKDACPFYFKK